MRTSVVSGFARVGLFAVIAGALVFALYFVSGCLEKRDRRVHLKISSDDSITYPQAIEISRAALRQVGVDVQNFTCEEWTGREPYTANSPNIGCFLSWNSTDGRRDFSVLLEQHGRDVDCFVTKVHITDSEQPWSIGPILHVLHGQVCFESAPNSEWDFGSCKSVMCFDKSTVIRAGGTCCIIELPYYLLLAGFAVLGLLPVVVLSYARRTWQGKRISGEE